MAEASAPEAAVLHDATPLIAGMRRGLRRDVQAFVNMLDGVGVHVALARPLPNVAMGTRQEMGDELTLSPHLLALNDTWVVALWSDADQLQTVGHYLNWTTDGESLHVCSLPARVGLEFALQLIDEKAVVGLVFNPGDETEVFLSRHEVASIASGQAIPLVGYVQEIPPHADEQTLVAELDNPLPAELIQTIEQWINESQFAGYKLEQTFNADRDLEPHLTLRVKANDQDSTTAQALIPPLLAKLEGQIPPPGYIDVVFE